MRLGNLSRALLPAQEWKATLYTPRLTTADAYRIYIEKDPSVRGHALLSLSVEAVCAVGVACEASNPTEESSSVCFPSDLYISVRAE
jgi:hypothetical protein